jgi:hypothetical protein
LIATLLYGATIGLIVGLIWAAALGLRLSVGLITGTAVGFVTAVVVLIPGQLARRGATNLQRGETAFVSNALLTALGIISGVIGFLVCVVRAVL